MIFSFLSLLLFISIFLLSFKFIQLKYFRQLLLNFKKKLENIFQSLIEYF